MSEESNFTLNRAEFDFVLPELKAIWPKSSQMLAVIVFGSRTKFPDPKPTSDYDIGVVYSGRRPQLIVAENWDLFLWPKKQWLAGFALQVEIARHGLILFDSDGIAQNQFQMIQDKILPFWGAYLKRF
ncbi:MAG: nucleotidyltransferase domain-containing protein [Leptonema sp. (in: Bacteria)]|nr:nucleotidyltransferase domain-containing protein [Leptonema sp. (in: bacteria)]